ncbi:M48 family metallopeptidase [Clostridium sp. DSM 100503]|uniref:M48 family metallopeptidase n=1 Tax=Clostridium sp. DSM 100503 TaxID=2963282 RepID=UPI0021499ECA|nr:SprT family zinc-dependent metalloprotease [Clostridium sp. DSM 100503]MCR1952650.1 M48 family metallopeptidase [Clostridium sp. DSM 100503]
MKRKVIFNNQTIEYLLIFKKKKNISIKIENSGEIKVFAPSGIDNNYIDDLIIKKGDWILKSLDKIKKKDYINNKVIFQGKYYNLIINKSDENNIFKDNINITINSKDLSREYINELLISWYKKLSIDIVGKRVMDISNNIYIKPSKIIIKNQKSLWGSCNSKREIRLNWRLVLMPQFVMDYIIIHELCHIKQMNHSKEFWKLVESYYPNYKESKDWLKENGAMLMNLT